MTAALKTAPPAPQPSTLPDSEARDTNALSIAGAAAVLSRHATNPSAFLALNAETSHFTVAGIDGFVAYRPAGRRCLVQFGGVFADAGNGDRDRLLASFLAWAKSERRRVVAVQLLRDDAETFARHGFIINQFGADYGRSLTDFSLRGGHFMQLRNKISRARRAGIVAVEIGVDQPASADLDAALDAIDAEWLRSKGRHVKELDFMVGERHGPAAPMRRLFVATDNAGEVAGYITFSPAYGPHGGWLHDLSRRRPAAPPGTMELVITTAVERFRAEGAGYLHFGFTPFTSIDRAHDLSCRSAVAAGLVRFLAAHGEHVYPAADQLAYKQKWAPDLVQPEYVAFAGGVSLRAVWGLLRLTNAL